MGFCHSVSELRFRDNDIAMSAPQVLVHGCDFAKEGRMSGRRPSKTELRRERWERLKERVGELIVLQLSMIVTLVLLFNALFKWLGL